LPTSEDRANTPGVVASGNRGGKKLKPSKNGKGKKSTQRDKKKKVQRAVTKAVSVRPVHPPPVGVPKRGGGGKEGRGIEGSFTRKKKNKWEGPPAAQKVGETVYKGNKELKLKIAASSGLGGRKRGWKT